MKISAPSPAPSGGPTSARRNASSSVANATAVSATRKKPNAAAKPEGAAGRSTAMSSASGSSAAPAAAAYQRPSARCRVAATAVPQAATPASSATAAARSSRHSWARRASLPSQISPAAHTAPSAKPLATSATRRRERAGPQENPSGRRAASSTTRAHAPAASGTAVPLTAGACALVVLLATRLPLGFSWGPARSRRLVADVASGFALGAVCAAGLIWDGNEARLAQLWRDDRAAAVALLAGVAAWGAAVAATRQRALGRWYAAAAGAALLPEALLIAVLRPAAPSGFAAAFGFFLVADTAVAFATEER